MNTEKTSLIQKLTLGVLTLILLCLVVLIAQNRSRPVASAESPAPAESMTPQTAIHERSNPEPPPKVAAAPIPRAVSEQPRTTPPAVTSAAQPESPRGISTAQQQPEVTLVNPVRPQSLDIIVHPQTPVLNTELCGRVRLEGKPPPEIPINMSERCNRLQDGPATTRHYVVGPGGGLANVLVYIKSGLLSEYVPPLLNAPTVTVSRCFFEPYVLGMQAGQKLTIINADPILHNARGTSKQNQQFNLALARKGQKAQKFLEKPEVFMRFKCDVHPWEFSYVGIVDNPFFAVTDANGAFCLPAGLPHGRYVLAAIHPKAGEVTQNIIVQAAWNDPIELALNVERR